MATTTQYITAIPSILFSVPGHPSSMHTVQEANSLSHDEKKHALKVASFHSFLAATVTALGLIAVSSFVGQYLAAFFRSEIIFLLLLLTLTLTTIFSKNSKIVSVVLLGAGVFLSFVGYNFFFDTNLTFGLIFLAAGFDPVIVVLLFLSFSEVLKNVVQLDQAPTYSKSTMHDQAGLGNSSIAAAVGTVGGLVPGLTTIASSSFYYYFGKFLKLSQKKLIVGTETANVSGSLSQILPVIYFGIPILASEALLLSLMQSKGFSMATFDLNEFFESAIVYFLIANVAALAICTIAARINFKLNLSLLKYLALVLLTTSLLGYLLLGGDPATKLLQLFLLLPVALLLRRFDNTPIVVGFLLSPMFFESASRIF
jgi:putative tricarboxylic transport membrane protein